MQRGVAGDATLTQAWLSSNIRPHGRERLGAGNEPGRRRQIMRLGVNRPGPSQKTVSPGEGHSTYSASPMKPVTTSTPCRTASGNFPGRAAWRTSSSPLRGDLVKPGFQGPARQYLAVGAVICGSKSAGAGPWRVYPRRWYAHRAWSICASSLRRGGRHRRFNRATGQLFYPLVGPQTKSRR